MRIGATVALVALALSLAPVAQAQECGAGRLLVAGSESPDAPPALWWFSPDDGQLERIDTDGQRAYLVAVSPDLHWVTYYQRSPLAPPDRFVVDAWVMDLTTGEQRKLADASTPIGWTSDSRGVVLGERPASMVLADTGEFVPTEGTVITATSLRAVDAPDGAIRAAVATSPNGIDGISLIDRATGDVVLEVPTGRSAVQLAWSPDSSHLAYTNAFNTPDGLVWRLRVIDVAARSVSVPEATRDMELYSVLWLPAGDCSPVP